MANESGGDGLVSSEGEVGLDSRTNGTGRRGQLGLEDRVAQDRASHRGIGARDSPEHGAGGGSAVQHVGGRYCMSHSKISQVRSLAGQQQTSGTAMLKRPPNWRDTNI